jgi:putative ABC transport system permease protein
MPGPIARRHSSRPNGFTLIELLVALTIVALLLSIIGTGLVASLIPGWRAWRMSLADGLTPRN